MLWMEDGQEDEHIPLVVLFDHPGEARQDKTRMQE